MGRSRGSFGALLAFCAGAGCASSAGTEAAATRQYTQEEEQAAWTAYMTPGDAHAKLASQAGKWDVTGKMWMHPDEPPAEMKGVAEFEMILGGRYQWQNCKGDFMGMPFEGNGIVAYDNALKKYMSFWIDSMGTGLMTMSGTMDSAGKVLTTSGEMTDPHGDTYWIRMVGTEKDADHMVFEMHVRGPQHPTEYRCMELSYTRRKE